MFIIDTNPSKEMLPLLKKVERFVGYIPPHFSLFATLNPKRFEMFLNEIFYLTMHKSINPDFFALLRFSFSAKHNFEYCYTFNKKLLLDKNYTKEAVEAFETNSDNFPLDKKHHALFKGVQKAIDEPKSFTCKDIDALKELGWSDADIYDAIDHGAFLFKFSKVLKAYKK